MFQECAELRGRVTDLQEQVAEQRFAAAKAEERVAQLEFERKDIASEIEALREEHVGRFPFAPIALCGTLRGGGAKELVSFGCSGRDSVV